jgi:beta-galactosidase
MNLRIRILLFVITLAYIGAAQSRVEYTINNDWNFYAGSIAFAQRESIKDYPIQVDASWQTISIPHTWNANDPFDDEESYRDGISWYRKKIEVPNSLQNKKIYLHFEGANQVTDVFVNGAFAAKHKGGYTAFTVDISDLVKLGQSNLIAVKVNNSPDNFIPPLSVGYCLYGGIYRDVWIVATDKVHFDMMNNGSKGVFISTQNVSNNSAGITIRGAIMNESEIAANITIKHSIRDKSGTLITETETNQRINPGEKLPFNTQSILVNNPTLWSPESPYLYTVKSQIIVDGKIVDELVNPLGFRWFEFDPNTGFHLNGKKYVLKGTNRHQDMRGLGDALPNSQHIADLVAIKEMGANFVRLAHYPQDPVVLAVADSLGLLIWEEIPVVNYVNCSDEFKTNTHVMLKEMIRQHYNHPSIILWGSCNEIFLWNGLGERANTITDELYMKWTRDFVASLDSAIHAEDSTRFSTLAIHGSDDYDKCGITSIPDVLSVNQYEGWYSGVFSSFGKNLDKRHENYPDQVLFVSEYGAGSDSRINTAMPERFDFSGNWQRMFHESYYQQIAERLWLAGSAMWNQYDFSQPHTGGTIQHVNQKGVQTWDRKKKDAFYFYKANWTAAPMVYIASREWINRNGLLNNNGGYDSKMSSNQTIEVYSNIAHIELFHNGNSLGIKESNAIGKTVWQVNFSLGDNKLLAKASEGTKLVEDSLYINFKTHSTNLKKDEEIFINLGFNAEFVDENGSIWLPDRYFTKGLYGAVNGEHFMANKDLIVVNTENRAVLYNYSLDGADIYRLDVPNGTYIVEMHFAETKFYQPDKRVFDISVNDLPVFENLDMYKTFGFLKAFSKTITVDATAGNGIQIKMDAKEGTSSISALHIKRIN